MPDASNAPSSRQPGVSQVSVNLASERASVSAPAGSLDSLIQAITAAGYQVPQQQLELQLGGMTCASCAGRIERALGKQPGVVTASVNLASERASLQILVGTEPASLIAAVQAAATRPARSPPRAATDSQAASLRRERWHLLLALLLSLPLALPMLLEPLLVKWFGGHWMLPAWLQFALATPVQFYCGARFYRAGWHAVRAGSGNMDLLVAIGTSAAFGLSLYLWWQAHAGHEPHLYFESAAVVISLVLLGKYLESRGKRQTGAAIRALQALRPQRAVRVTASGEGRHRHRAAAHG